MNRKQLIEQVDVLFSKRGNYVSLLQEIADNFYPERADFTVKRHIGTTFAENLTTSYPIIVRRELGDQIGMMLRPTNKEWFHMGLVEEDQLDHEAKKWLSWADGIMRRAMYDPKSKFSRASKEADHDFGAFGCAAISVRLNKNADALLYRTFHIRDMVWMEDEDGEIVLIARKNKTKLYDLVKLFGSKNHSSVNTDSQKKPFEEIECYHIVVNSELFDEDSKGKPYFSIYYDKPHDTFLEVVPSFIREYVIPRWQTVSGSQYPYSPATVAGLPDARLLQSMTYTLLEAGEKATNPPMVATQDAVKSDISIYAGGVTWVDADYDEKLGAALRPIAQDYHNLPIGMDIMRDTRQMLHNAFFLNKLSLPDRAPEMTAYEIGQRVQEYIRGALPIFEPMEMDYNGGICEATFDVLLRAGAFGSPQNMPRSLSGQTIRFRFESPLHDAIEQQKGQLWQQTEQILSTSAGLDPTVLALPDTRQALRDVLEGIGVPPKWLHSDEEVQKTLQQEQAKQQAQQTLAAMEQGSNVAANMSKASQGLNEASQAGS